MPEHHYQGLGTHHSIMKVSKYGETVTLDDLSQWTIRIGDSTKTSLWYPTQRISVIESENDVYPYKLKNLDTFEQQEVEAQLGARSRGRVRKKKSKQS